MIEKVMHFMLTDEKIVEKAVMDENINLIHMVFDKGQGLPVHQSNSNVYMIIIRGVLSIELDDQDTHTYKSGDILNIPFDTRMDVKNMHEEVLEMFVVKSPAPKNYKSI